MAKIGARVRIRTKIAAPTERVWAEVQTPRLFLHITAPLVRFAPVSGEIPAEFEEGRFDVKLKLFGVVPMGEQAIVVTKHVGQEDGALVWKIRDNGFSRMIPKWDHWIVLRRTGPAETLYEDDVTIEAGLLTPFIWAFAALFYRWRQHRWRGLARSGFRYA